MSRAEHLATLGELATGLAHEIRNPLAGIAGVIEIIGRDLPATSPARAVVKDVRQEIAQINRILTDLLQTARPHPPEIRRSDLNTTVEHAVMLARQQAMSKPIEIELHKDRSPAGNRARQRSDSPGPAEPAAQRHPGDRRPTEISLSKLKHAGATAVVEVTDNGRGIPPEHLPNIFRPFYTTKGNGTGLGLSLARRIVEEHHGRIDVTERPRQGHHFRSRAAVTKNSSPRFFL